MSPKKPSILRGVRVNRWYGSLTTDQRRRIDKDKQWNGLTLDQKEQIMKRYSNIGVITNSLMSDNTPVIERDPNALKREPKRRVFLTSWTDEDVENLIAMRERGMMFTTIATRLKRSSSSCSTKYRSVMKERGEYKPTPRNYATQSKQ